MHLVLFFLFLIVCAAAAVFGKKLTLAAAVVGAVVAAFIYAGEGWAGIALLATFFVLGTGATSWHKRTKAALGILENNEGRKPGQVLANGGLAGMLGCLALISPMMKPILLLLIAGAFSSAAADTLSSELGSVYGRRFYDILTWKKGLRGRDGVVSLEGSLFGLTGSIIIAVVHALFTVWSLNSLLLIIMAGTAGNLADSYLGATLERKGIIGNDTVNFLNTALATLLIFLLQKF